MCLGRRGKAISNVRLAPAASSSGSSHHKLQGKGAQAQRRRASGKIFRIRQQRNEASEVQGLTIRGFLNKPCLTLSEVPKACLGLPILGFRLLNRTWIQR